jgi:hypothetical protein
MKNNYGIIETNEYLSNKLLDNCTLEEIQNFYNLMDDLTVRTLSWYCRSKKNRKIIKLVLEDKLEMNFRYEFSPIQDEEL